MTEEERNKRNEKCAKCKIRKYIARVADCHFDWVDCPYDCENNRMSDEVKE